MFAPKGVGKKFLAKVAGVLVLGGAILWMEPWAERFQGQTVRGWLKRFAEKREIEQGVLDAFGARAVPELVKVIETAQRRRDRRELWENLHDEVRSALKLPALKRDRSDEHQPLVAAGTWLSWLKAKGHPLEEKSFPPKVIQWLDIWDDTFWAPRWIQLVLTTPEESKTERGKEVGNKIASPSSSEGK